MERNSIEREPQNGPYDPYRQSSQLLAGSKALELNMDE